MQWWPARTQTPERSGSGPRRGGGSRAGRRDHASAAVGGRPVMTMPAPRVEQVERVGDDVVLVIAHPIHPEVAQVVRGHAEADGRADVRRAGLELPGDVVELGPAKLTSRIMSPPARNGGIASSSSRRPHSTPEPVGPIILCPEKKSAPSAWTSTGRSAWPGRRPRAPAHPPHGPSRSSRGWG